MRAETEILLLPYDSAAGNSLLQRLLLELTSGAWTRFRAAVAFAKSSGNYEALLSALHSFATSGGRVELTFGADVFGADTKGSDFDAIETLLAAIGDLPSVRLHLYHEKGRTFHSKVYLFDAEADQQRSLLIIGSSNWSRGGLVNNVEVDVIIHLDLSDVEHRALYERMVDCFESYWGAP